MPSLDVIRTLTLRARAEGFAQAGQAVTALGEQYDTSARRQLSMERTLASLERRFISSARETQDYQRTQEQLNRITAQFPQLQERANAVLDAAASRFNQLQSVSGTVAAQFGRVTSQLSIMQNNVMTTVTGLGALGNNFGSLQNGSAAVTARMGAFSNQLASVQGGLTATSTTLGTLGNQFGALNARIGVGGAGAGAGAASQMQQFGNQSKAARYELINLSRQIQDVGVGLSSGQSPFTVLIQQGSQIADVFASSQLTMAQWAERFFSFFTPARLLVLGFTAAVGALAFAFIKLTESAVTTEKVLKNQGDTLEQLRKAYSDSTSAAGSFLEVSRAILELEIARGIRESQEQIERLGESFRKISAKPVAVPLDVLLPPGFENIPQILETTETGFAELNVILNRFNQSAKGWQDVKRMRDELAATANVTRDTNPVLAQQAERYFDLTKEIGTVAEALRKWEAAQRVNNGTAEETDRATVGLSKTLRELPFDQLVKRTQEQIELRELETVSIGKSEAEVKKLKLQFDAERTSREALTAEQQHTIDLLKLEIEIAELNNEARKKAIDLINKEAKERERIAQSFDQFLQRTRDAISERNAEADSVGKSEAAVRQLRIQHEAERINRGPLSEAQQKNVDQLKNEAAAAEDNLKRRKDEESVRNRLTRATERQAEAQKKLRDELARETETVFMSEEDIRIAERLKELYPDVTDALKSSEAAQIRFNNRVREAKDLAGDFLNTFISGLIEGKSVTDALAKSVQSLGAAITQAATKQIGTSIIGTAGVGEAAGTGIAGLLGAGGLGLSGLALGAATGGIGLAVGVGLSFLGKMLEDNEKEAQEAAQAAEKFNQELQQSQQSLQEATSALAAMGQTTGQFTGQMQQAQQALNNVLTQAQAQIQLAQTQGGVTIAAPVAIAAQQQAIQAMQEAQEQFKRVTEGIIEAGRAALRGAEDLTPVQQRLKEIEDTAADVSEAMLSLGMNSEEVARIIADDLVVAMQRLKDSIERDLISKINELSGRGFVNQLNDMFEAIADAQRAGVDPRIIADFTRLQAQSIVDQAELTGEAFQQMLQMFPQLTGVVHEWTGAAEKAAEEQKRLAEQMSKTFSDISKSIRKFLDELKSGSQSTLAPIDRLREAQKQYNEQLRLAQAGNEEALRNITQYANNLLEAAKVVYASSKGFQDIFSQVTSDLESLAGSAQTMSDQLAVTGGVVVQAQALGGWIRAANDNMQRLQYGGRVTDTVPALLTPQEFVIRKEVAQANAGWLPQFNATGATPFGMGNLDTLGDKIQRAVVASTIADVNAQKEISQQLASLLERLTRVVEANKPVPRLPGTVTGSKAA